MEEEKNPLQNFSVEKSLNSRGSEAFWTACYFTGHKDLLWWEVTDQAPV